MFMHLKELIIVSKNCHTLKSEYVLQSNGTHLNAIFTMSYICIYKKLEIY